jgi:hypothetical protein
MLHFRAGPKATSPAVPAEGAAMFPSRVPLLRHWSNALLMAAGAGVLLAAPAISMAHAAPTMKACGEQWRAAKAAGSVPDGQTWVQFLKICRSGAGGSGATEQAPAAVATAPDCGEQWKAAKAAGTVPAGQTWPQYLAACRSSAPAGAATAATELAAAPAAAGDQTVAAPAKSAAGSVMKQCGERWQAAKAAGTAAAGTTWRTYLADCRAELKSAPGQAAAPATAGATPSATGAAPQTVATVDIDPGSNKAAPASSKAAAPGEAKTALNARRKACGAEWKQAKVAGAATGQTWPKFWSACNTRLKNAAVTAQPAG